MTAGLHIKLLTGRGAVVPLRDSIEALCQDLCESNPYFEPWFLFPGLQHLGKDRKVHFLCFYETHGKQRLCGFLPLAEARLHPLLPLGTYEVWAHSQCFRCTPLVRNGFAEPFWLALLSWLEDLPWHRRLLHLQRQPADGELWRALERVLGDRPSLRSLFFGYSTAFMRVGSNYAETIGKAMSGRTRRKLENSSRRLAKKGEVSFSDIGDGQPVDSLIEEFLQLESSGWKGRAETALASRQNEAAFFREVIRAAADRRRLCFLSLRLDGRMIAAQPVLLAPPGAFLFKVAYDESFRRQSPGVLLEMEEVRRMHDPGDPLRVGLAWSDSCAGPDDGPGYRCYPDRLPVARCRITTAGAPHALAIAAWPMIRPYFVKRLGQEVRHLTARGWRDRAQGGSASSLRQG